MRPVVATLATFPPAALPIWARLQLIAKGVPFLSVTHWQRGWDGSMVRVFTTRGPVGLAK